MMETEEADNSNFVPIPTAVPNCQQGTTPAQLGTNEPTDPSGYVLEVEVESQENCEIVSNELPSGKSVFMKGGNSFDAVKNQGVNCYEVGEMCIEPKNEVEISTNDTQTQLIENVSKLVNGKFHVIYDQGQTVIVLGEDCQLSEKDIEMIKDQVCDETTDGSAIPDISRGQSCEVEISPVEVTTIETSHLMSKEDEIRTCHQCGAEFGSSDDLVHHFVKEHSSSVKCQYCEQILPSISDAIQHKKEVHTKLKCSVCKKTFTGTLSLEEHIQNRHSQGTKCGSCFRYFKTREEMESHIEEAHRTNKCPICGKGFYFKTSMLNHVEGEHGLDVITDNNSALNDLDEKGEVLPNGVPANNTTNIVKTKIPFHKSTGDLRASEKTEEPSRRRTLSHLETELNDRSSTKRPKQELTNKPTLKCTLCDQKFESGEEDQNLLLYSTHVACIHDNFTCKKCDQDQLNYRTFLAHMKSEHNLSSSLITCPYCHEDFYTKRTFDLHKRDKWKRCPMAKACTQCSEVFLSEDKLNCHYSTKHKDS